MKIENYCTVSGHEPVKEFISFLPEETRNEVFTLLKRLENNEILPMPQCRSLSSIASGLYELRIRDEQGQVRIFYYTKVRDCIFLVHALRKKSRTIQDKDRRLIIKRLKELRLIERG